MAKDLTKIVLRTFLIGLLVVFLILFLPAGSFRFWPGWLYIFTLFVPMSLVMLYFLKNDPKLLERRLRVREREKEQKLFVKLSTLCFLVGFLLPGFDFRWGWSNLSSSLIVFSDFMILLGYFVFFLVLRENSYASRVVEVEKGQKVIDSGPYSLVRHPMYLGVLLMFMFTPLALGSVFALLAFIPLPFLLVLRILNEEKVLLRDLEGYREYCLKTKYRLIPFVW